LRDVQLQHNVRGTLETLRNAGIKIWMLTGDKVETATTIAISSRLVSRTETLFTIANVKTRADARASLQAFAAQRDACLIVDGGSLAVRWQCMRARCALMSGSCAWSTLSRTSSRSPHARDRSCAVAARRRRRRSSSN
jgi:hypothetical protein